MLRMILVINKEDNRLRLVRIHEQIHISNPPSTLQLISIFKESNHSLTDMSIRTQS